MATPVGAARTTADGFQPARAIAASSGSRRRAASSRSVGAFLPRAVERDLRPQPLQSDAFELVERSKLGGRQQLERRVGCRSIELGLRGSQRPPPRSAGSGVNSTARARNAAAAAPPTRLRPVGRALQLAGHRLVNSHRRVRTMPPPTIGIRPGRSRAPDPRRSRHLDPTGTHVVGCLRPRHGRRRAASRSRLAHRSHDVRRLARRRDALVTTWPAPAPTPPWATATTGKPCSSRSARR